MGHVSKESLKFLPDRQRFIAWDSLILDPRNRLQNNVRQVTYRLRTAHTNSSFYYLIASTTVDYWVQCVYFCVYSSSSYEITPTKLKHCLGHRHLYNWIGHNVFYIRLIQHYTIKLPSVRWAIKYNGSSIMVIGLERVGLIDLL